VSVARKEVAREKEEAKRWSDIMVEEGLISGGKDRSASLSVRPQRPPPPVPPRSVRVSYIILLFFELDPFTDTVAILNAVVLNKIQYYGPYAC